MEKMEEKISTDADLAKKKYKGSEEGGGGWGGGGSVWVGGGGGDSFPLVARAIVRTGDEIGIHQREISYIFATYSEVKKKEDNEKLTKKRTFTGLRIFGTRTRKKNRKK